MVNVYLSYNSLLGGSIIAKVLFRVKCSNKIKGKIDHFTVSCLVAWPLNESEAGGDLVLIETSLLFSC